jgi:FkbM family methyltransferase
MRLKTNQTCHVTNVVFWNGPDSYEYTTIFQALFPNIKVYFDVGANIGYLSIIAGTINRNLQVFAFDPSPGPFAYLCDNIELNNLKNVHAFDLALSDQDGNFSFHFAYNAKYPYLKHSSLGGSGHLSHVRENPTTYTVKVKATTLDNFIETNKIEGLDLLKLDVEEAEHLVLAGGRKSIARFRPIVVCEVFSDEMLESINKEIISLGYYAYIFESQMLRKVNLHDYSGISKIENFFFVPEEKAHLIKDFVL